MEANGNMMPNMSLLFCQNTRKPWMHIRKKILRRAAFDSNIDMPELHVAHDVAHDYCLDISYVASVRTPSSKPKARKRKGAREVKQVGMQADENQKLTA